METVWMVLSQLVLLHTVSASLVNEARRKPASMSSSYLGKTAGTAVDGDIIHTGIIGIIHTAHNQPFAWWKVDLETEVQDATVRIYFRTGYTWRRNGVKLYTSTSPFPESNPTRQGQLCHTVSGSPSGGDIPDVYNVTCPGRWRYLLLYTDTDNDGRGAILDFREVEVLACSDGTYGENCIKLCNSRNCVTLTTTCERGGRCLDGCQTGYTKLDCTQECESGAYGPNCSLSCSARECSDDSSPCDHVTGQCVGGCKPGYWDLDCRYPYPSDTANKDQASPSMATLVGAVVGSNVLVVLLCVGIHICLIRLGRLQWVKSLEDKKPNEVSRDNNEMGTIYTQPANELVDSNRHIYNNDYAVMDSKALADNKEYDVIQPRVYDNI